ncbi:MAG TPA: SagB/ThcOx family dehydrogenase [Gaiellaceae bacterium]|nr:SagB/ThcOx family dehydrogenase [Gaiellaceae bacterium]
MIYGADGVGAEDPAEVYHEASKLYPSFAGRQTRGWLIERNQAIAAATLRAVKRHPLAEAIPLPPARFPAVSLEQAVARRKSTRSFAPGRPLELEGVGTMLHAAYGVTHQLDPDAPAGSSPSFRTVPSGGGLYPLELYVAALEVAGLPSGLYHFDPLRHVLECLQRRDLRSELSRAAVHEDVIATAGAVVVVSAMFWRSRFKYGQRSYRFALLEAGHVVQNLLLTAAALGLGAVPIGGFYDRRLDDLLAIDGVNESAVYSAVVGALP